jgi:hypothetical protein
MKQLTRLFDSMDAHHLVVEQSICWRVWRLVDLVPRSICASGLGSLPDRWTGGLLGGTTSESHLFGLSRNRSDIRMETKVGRSYLTTRFNPVHKSLLPWLDKGKISIAERFRREYTVGLGWASCVHEC